MPTKEITTILKNQIALNVQVISSDTTTAGNIIDTADFDGGVNFTMFSGAYNDGTYIALIEDGEDSGLSDAAPVVDALLRAQDPTSSTAPEAQTAITSANAIKKIGYVGIKPFVRISIVSTSTSSGATLGAIVEKMEEVLPATLT